MVQDRACARVRVPEHVVFRVFEAETVVLNLETGRYHGLNATAGRFLEVLAESGSIPATAATVASEFGIDEGRAAGDLATLCDQLLERGLLEVSEPET